MIASFIDEQRAKGRAVKSVYTVVREQGVRIAARTYRAMKHRDASVRDWADAVDVDVSLSTVDQPKGMYGQRKMVAYLRHTGHGVSHRRVDRLMR